MLLLFLEEKPGASEKSYEPLISPGLLTSRVDSVMSEQQLRVESPQSMRSTAPSHPRDQVVGRDDILEAIDKHGPVLSGEREIGRGQEGSVCLWGEGEGGRRNVSIKF